MCGDNPNTLFETLLGGPCEGAHTVSTLFLCQWLDGSRGKVVVVWMGGGGWIDGSVGRWCFVKGVGVMD